MLHPDIFAAAWVSLVEGHTDVHHECIDDVSAWSFIRTAMHFALMDAVSARGNSPAALAALQTAASHSLASRGLPAAVHTAPPVVHRRAPVDGPMLVAARGQTHHVIDGGMHVSPIADGWISLLTRIGARPLKIEVNPEWLSLNQPRRHPAIAPAAPTANALRDAAAVVGSRWLPRLQAVLHEANAVVEQATGVRVAFERALLEAAIRFVAERVEAERWLDALRPSAVLTICYYEAKYLPMLAACRARGIPTVDLQHGINGFVHTSYSHFTRVPADGYALLPDWFLTWGEHSSANVLRWRSDSVRHHQPLVGGRPDLNPAVLGPPPPVAAAVLTTAARAARRIVVTLQDKGLADAFVAEMAASSPDWLWLLRTHPGAQPPSPASAEAIRAHLARANVRNAVVVPPGSCRLSDLLSIADFHVTAFSSSWMEATIYGVPTAFTDPSTAQLYAHELAQGMATLVPHGEGLRTTVEQSGRLSDDRGRAIIDTSTTTAERAMSHILGL